MAPVFSRPEKKAMKTTTLFLLLVLPAAAQTVAVGNCRPHLTSYRTISEAVGSALPNSTVLICPGSYPEQVIVSQPLTLRGLNLGTPGNDPVIAIPRGGLMVTDAAGDAAQLSVHASTGPVNIYDVVVDGKGSTFNCSTGASLIGIKYTDTSGSLIWVNATNQHPGGCGVGISLVGNPFVVNTVNVRHGTFSNFDNTGILATYSNFELIKDGFLVNLDSTSIYSTSRSVSAGVNYTGASGLLQHNNITVAGQYGLVLETLFVGLTARDNTVTVTGAGTGILSGTDGGGVTDIINNSVIGGSTGIAVPLGFGIRIQENIIAGSSVHAINANCSELLIAARNTIFDAPVGIANLVSTGALSQNVFYNVPVETIPCD